MCHLDTTFGFLQRHIKYTRCKGFAAVMTEGLKLAAVAVIGGGVNVKSS